MPCYYNCPHEYVVRERDLFIPWAPWGCPEKDFQFFKKTIRTHGERKKWRHRRDVVLFDGRYRLLADWANYQSHRSTLDDEWRTPASEGSGADAEKVLADYSRPEAV